MTANQLRQKYLSFFESKGHKVIPPAPLIPENDPTTLFTSSGMQQLVPYLKGQAHPQGKRLVDSQPCFRASDIEEVGDDRHTTFFEMLGNWSLGDYFKKEQLSWVWEFLTNKKWIGLPKEKLHVTLFKGNQDVSKDEESFSIWQNLGVSKENIHFYDATKNWWSRSGTPDKMPPGEIGGPDSEIFYDFGEDLKIHETSKFKDQKCHVNCDCGRFLEIGNSVFMQYEKQKDGTFKPLPKQNVDFGGGFERLLAVVQNEPDIFKTELFYPLIQELEKVSNKKYQDYKPAMQVIADHLKAAVFLIAQGLEPSNKQQGYVLRRLIRRAVMKMSNLNIEDYSQITNNIVSQVSQIYSQVYPEVKHIKNTTSVLNTEIDKFKKTLDKGLREFNKLSQIDGKAAFDLFQTYGFPLEITTELAQEKGLSVDKNQFKKELEKHQEISRTASAGMFKGGLADTSETTTKYHTATHLLHQALRDVLGDHVKQAGSNITSERLRFDFTHQEALTEEELSKIEKIINQKIEEDLPVTYKKMSYKEAMDSGALAFFKQKYPDQVTVYSIGNYSKELCGGPHVTNTGQIGKIKIDKQKALGQGLRRVYLKFI